LDVVGDGKDADFLSIESEVRTQMEEQLHPLRSREMREIFPVLNYFASDKRELDKDEEGSPARTPVEDFAKKRKFD